MPTLVAPALTVDGDLIRFENGTIAIDTWFTSLSVGKVVQDPDMGSWETRGYLAFDVSGLPSEATITGVTLRLYVVSYQAPPPFPSGTLQVVETGWSAPLGVDHWNASPRVGGHTFVVGVGTVGTFVDVPVGTLPISGGVASLRLEMISTPEPGAWSRVLVASADSSTVDWRPQLTITYSLGTEVPLTVEGNLAVVSGWGTPLEVQASLEAEGRLTVIAGFGQEIPVQAALNVEGQLTLIVFQTIVSPAVPLVSEGQLTVVGQTTPPVAGAAPLTAEGVLEVVVSGSSAVEVRSSLQLEGMVDVWYVVGGDDAVFGSAHLQVDGTLVVSALVLGGSDTVAAALRVEGQLSVGGSVGGGDVIVGATCEMGVGATIVATVAPHSIKLVRPNPMLLVFGAEASGVRRDRWVVAQMRFAVQMLGEAVRARREAVMCAVEVWLEVESGDPW